MIELKDICKIYGKKNTEVSALEHINLSVPNGGFLAIMGPSGSGKSTLMNILGCLDRPTSGQYFLNGIDVSPLNADRAAELRNQYIGFIFQSFLLLPKLTVYENIELPMLYANVPPEIRRKTVLELAELVGLEHRLQHIPCELSGGQCQRVAIARSLVNHPKLILADEPTGNLDSKTSLDIIQTIGRLNKRGVTVVLITHEQEIANAAKRIIRIKDGQIMEEEQYAAV